ncbi:MAG: hypothetical protein ABR521_11900 [Gaiellaceae bacterium]
MAEGFSSRDVLPRSRVVLGTFDELAGFLRASAEVPEDSEAADAVRVDGEPEREPNKLEEA